MLQKFSYTLDQVAIQTGCGKTKIYQEINSGRLRAQKLGKRTLVTQEALQEWLAALPAYKGG